MANENLATELLEAVRERFQYRLELSPMIRTLQKRITEGEALYRDVENYGDLVGQCLGQAFADVLTPDSLPDGKFYEELAQQIIRPMLQDDHELMSKAAVAVQESLNKKAGIGLRAQAVSLDTDRVNGIIAATQKHDTITQALPELEANVRNYSMHVADAVLEANIEFQGKVGLYPRIIRIAEHGCCKWCSELAGTFTYPNVPSDVYRRHRDCRCTVDYDPGDRSGRLQNVHSKKWTTEEERAKLEARRSFGVKTLPHQLAEHPSQLAAYTPASLMGALKNAGFDVKPLKQGHLKNILFEDGGGFKVNFDDGGILQYHPESHSHHGGAYYKISTGKGGKHWYELDGTEKPK